MCGPVVAPIVKTKATQQHRTYVRLSGWKDGLHRKLLMDRIAEEMGSDFETEQQVRHATLFCVVKDHNSTEEDEESDYLSEEDSQDAGEERGRTREAALPSRY